MKSPTRTAKLTDWERFVLDYGWRSQAYEMSAVIGQSVEDIERIRRTGACKRHPKGKRFAELFTLWHGRPPVEEDWPMPRKQGAGCTYEWQDPETALLASLVGQMSVMEIAKILTLRLRKITGDRQSGRSKNATQVRTNLIGLQSTDVIGGITTAQAGREIGSMAIINQVIHKKQLRAVRRGRLWVIPHVAWEEWKATRVFPPQGYVQLSTIRTKLAIRSDKLSEFARMGLIPTAIRCNPYGNGKSTQFGTWWIDKKVATKLLVDRRAGRAMPWHGKYADNLRVSFKLWQKRQHPAACKTCAELWGKQGAPKSFEDYSVRYPTLAHGAKRHLTRPWSPGLTLAEVAAQSCHNIASIRRAVANGMLAVTWERNRQYVSRTDATRWIARHCPTGEGEKSWLALQTASDQYLFTLRELRGFIAAGTLKSKIGTDGPMRNVLYVSRHQCGQLRERIGFTDEQAARRLGVTVARFIRLLEGVGWRKAGGIPLATVQAVRKRIASRHGYSIEEAAKEVRKSAQWIRERIKDGTIRMARAKWDRRRTYITEPMLKRLRAFKKTPAVQERFGTDWLALSDAAMEAGVTATTLNKWANNGELARRHSKTGWRYHRAAVRANARRYWQTVRFHRATPPAWLRGDAAAAARA